MSKVCVLIPSHLYYQGQIELLDRCLYSILDNTCKPDIYVSVSFENSSFKNQFGDKILKKYNLDNVRFKLQKNKKFQMEHLHILSNFVDDYELVMFCDDDDTYDKKRIEIFINLYFLCKINGGSENLGGIKEQRTHKGVFVKENIYLEYWCYGIRPDIFKVFFKRFGDNLDILKHRFADLYFRTYLQISGIGKLRFGTAPSISNLYKYNMNNDNCISLNIPDTLHEQIRLGILLFHSQYDYFNDKQALLKVLRNKVRNFKTYNELKVFVPNIDDITNTLKIVYDPSMPV